jgi:hypothetical protein
MLYNPKWELLIKTGPSFPGLIAWLERQPPGGAYDYANADACAAGLYYKSIGVAPQEWVSGPPSCIASDLDSDPSLLAEILGGGEQTFGAALQRARACGCL